MRLGSEWYSTIQELEAAIATLARGQNPFEGVDLSAAEIKEVEQALQRTLNEVMSGGLTGACGAGSHECDDASSPILG